MLLEIAIGDAYGAGMEFTDPDHIAQHNHLSGYCSHPRYDIGSGRYTDDTQMALAVAAVMVSGQPWTRETLVESFLRAFKRDPRVGYAGKFYAFLQSVDTVAEFLDRMVPTSSKSGSAMRAGPIGLYPTEGEVIEKASIQATITHDTEDGINAAVAAALMTHYFAYRRGPKAQLGEYLSARVPGDWTTPWSGPAETYGWMCVRAAVTAIQQNDTLASILKHCVAWGGDVDTVAAIAMGPVSSMADIDRAVPAALLAGLERGPYGFDYLKALDQRLRARFPHAEFSPN